MTRRVLRVATRGSDLALAQSGAIARRVAKTLGCEAELVVITTSGDVMKDVPLANIGGKGLFVKEIEEALLANEADIAVHSAKDLPAAVAPGCALAVFPERVDPRDALVGPAQGERVSVASLPRGARVGTGSARRGAQLLAQRPDLEMVALRGNVPTRIQKIADDDLAAVVLACAGLERLGLAERIHERIATDQLLPAVCQGTLALETRADDPLREELQAVSDPDATLATEAERAFLLRLEGDCNVPLAAFAERDGAHGLKLRGLVCELAGGRIVRDEAQCELPRAGVAERCAAAAALGRRVGDAVIAAGGDVILAEHRARADAERAERGGS